VVFVEYWKREEIDLSIRWDVKGVGELKVNRPQYVWEREEVDPVTGEMKRIFPTYKRILRQLWFLPFAALAGLALGTVLLVTFALEALMSDVYGNVLADRWVCSDAALLLCMATNNLLRSTCNTSPRSYCLWHCLT
jgi:anoctamin-10